jgi:hypothetical protein
MEHEALVPLGCSQDECAVRLQAEREERPLRYDRLRTTADCGGVYPQGDAEGGQCTDRLGVGEVRLRTKRDRLLHPVIFALERRRELLHLDPRSRRVGVAMDQPDEPSRKTWGERTHHEAYAVAGASSQRVAITKELHRRE